jgi:hypothetical protein
MEQALDLFALLPGELLLAVLQQTQVLTTSDRQELLDNNHVHQSGQETSTARGQRIQAS